MRALWEAASEDEHKTAHRLCVGILEWWLGKSTRLEVAQRLSLPPVRLWQLSQQALSGMLAGLLHQPRRRGPPPSRDHLQRPAQDVATLRKETLELRRRLAVAEEVTSVLRELKTAAETKARSASPSPSKARRARRGGKTASSQPRKSASPAAPSVNGPAG